MEPLLILPIIISFFVVFFLIKFWIRKAKQLGLVWDDMNKVNSDKVAGSGGLIVILGFIIGILFYIAIKIFYFHSSENLIEIFALLVSVLIIAGVGLIDDLFGWQHGGLSVRSRIILVAFAAIPLMVINAGNPTIYLPFIGQINVWLLYPLIFIPIGIIGASTTFNFLAGFNGLEASQGILILSSLAIASWLTGSTWLSLISICMIVSLIAFLYYNKYPAKVFPGDILTYPIGALIAIMAILGNYEMFALFVFLPYILETILKLRGNLKKSSFGKPQKDGSIKNQYNKIYGLEHLAINILERFKPSKKAYEWEVVLLINLFQAILILIGIFVLII